MRPHKGKPTKIKWQTWLVLVFLIFVVSFFIFLNLSLRKSDFFWLSRLNFVYANAEEVLIISMEGKKGKVVSLSSKEKLSVSRGLGEYELGKVYALGELEEKGGELLEETVQQNKNAAIFGYFYGDSPARTDFRNLASWLRKIIALSF